MQDIVNTFQGVLSPAEVQQLVAMAPRLAHQHRAARRQPSPPPPAPQPPSQPYGRPWTGGRHGALQAAAAAERLAERRRQQEAALEQQRRRAAEAQAQREQYARTMGDLAAATRQMLPQCSEDEAQSQSLPETAHALAHAGALVARG